MKLFEQLFCRHSHSTTTAPTSHDWIGRSGKSYHYTIFPLKASFKPLPGLYIYAKLLPDGDWIPVYISQTRDLHQRLEGHVSLADTTAQGATHLHAHYCTASQAARCSEENDLIHRWHPICNDVFPD